MTKKDNGEIFFSWEFPEYIKYSRTKWWYIGMGLLAGAIIIYALIVKNFLFALIIIMAGIIPEVVWLATGGKNGCRWTDPEVYSALAGRSVVFYPDQGAFQEWRDKVKVLGTVCDISISELVENKEGV